MFHGDIWLINNISTEVFLCSGFGCTGKCQDQVCFHKNYEKTNPHTVYLSYRYFRRNSKYLAKYFFSRSYYLNANVPTKCQGRKKKKKKEYLLSTRRNFCRKRRDHVHGKPAVQKHYIEIDLKFSLKANFSLDFLRFCFWVKQPVHNTAKLKRTTIRSTRIIKK